MKVLTTLAENDYFLGVAALLNSVEHHGRYIDRIIIGYRGDLPTWLPPLDQHEHGSFCWLADGLELLLVPMDGQHHMVHEKPRWFQYVKDKLANGADECFFFDSDITVNRRMDFFGEWAREGVAVSGDVNYIFSPTHPIRRRWASLCRSAGLEVRNTLHGHFNSGYLGWTAATAPFVDDWVRAFDLLAPHAGDMSRFRVKDRTHTVVSANQDSFNVALMITECPIADIGPEAMGLINGLQVMHHPLGPKPWNINFTKNFLVGKRPRPSDYKFWKYVNGPLLKPLSPLLVKRKLATIKACRIGTRFYGK